MATATVQLASVDEPRFNIYEFEPGKFWMTVNVGDDVSFFMPGMNSACVDAARKLAEALTRGADELREKLGLAPSEPLAATAARLDRKVDDLVKDHQQALDLLRGLIGLLEIGAGVGAEALLTNHRYVDAVAWLTEHEGVAHGN